MAHTHLYRSSSFSTRERRLLNDVEGPKPAEMVELAGEVPAEPMAAAKKRIDAAKPEDAEAAAKRLEEQRRAATPEARINVALMEAQKVIGDPQAKEVDKVFAAIRLMMAVTAIIKGPATSPSPAPLLPRRDGAPEDEHAPTRTKEGKRPWKKSREDREEDGGSSRGRRAGRERRERDEDREEEDDEEDAPRRRRRRGGDRERSRDRGDRGPAFRVERREDPAADWAHPSEVDNPIETKEELPDVEEVDRDLERRSEELSALRKRAHKLEDEGASNAVLDRIYNQIDQAEYDVRADRRFIRDIQKYGKALDREYDKRTKKVEKYGSDAESNVQMTLNGDELSVTYPEGTDLKKVEEKMRAGGLLTAGADIDIRGNVLILTVPASFWQQNRVVKTVLKGLANVPQPAEEKVEEDAEVEGPDAQLEKLKRQSLDEILPTIVEKVGSNQEATDDLKALGEATVKYREIAQKAGKQVDALQKAVVEAGAAIVGPENDFEIVYKDNPVRYELKEIVGADANPIGGNDAQPPAGEKVGENPGESPEALDGIVEQLKESHPKLMKAARELNDQSNRDSFEAVRALLASERSLFTQNAELLRAHAADQIKLPALPDGTSIVEGTDQSFGSLLTEMQADHVYAETQVDTFHEKLFRKDWQQIQSETDALSPSLQPGDSADTRRPLLAAVTRELRFLSSAPGQNPLDAPILDRIAGVKTDVAARLPVLQNYKQTLDDMDKVDADFARIRA